MIKGLIYKRNNMKTVVFKTTNGQKEKFETLPLHPSNYGFEFKNSDTITFTIVGSWVDLDVVYYAKLV
jgi:hypothetical protein